VVSGARRSGPPVRQPWPVNLSIVSTQILRFAAVDASRRAFSGEEWGSGKDPRRRALKVILLAGDRLWVLPVVGAFADLRPLYPQSGYRGIICQRQL